MATQSSNDALGDWRIVNESLSMVPPDNVPSLHQLLTPSQRTGLSTHTSLKSHYKTHDITIISRRGRDGNLDYAEDEEALRTQPVPYLERFANAFGYTEWYTEVVLDKDGLLRLGINLPEMQLYNEAHRFFLKEAKVSDGSVNRIIRKRPMGSLS
ncbi:hypothetical protein FCIRC_10639 [Fusarium circinatum]|uniref:Uncharacterized protein n=1 Tax=Fusarium circinatum TaxID=48490 RepID=A0A8H5WJI8_FUSCI|nr:hypothetical protein FCIRC_10639 [Fusarium circinatum]